MSSAAAVAAVDTEPQPTPPAAPAVSVDSPASRTTSNPGTPRSLTPHANTPPPSSATVTAGLHYTQSTASNPTAQLANAQAALAVAAAAAQQRQQHHVQHLVGAQQLQHPYLQLPSSYSAGSGNLMALGGAAAGLSSRQQAQSKYSQLLSVIEDLGKDIRPTYSGSKTSAERLKRGIVHARILVRECLMESEKSARQN